MDLNDLLLEPMIKNYLKDFKTNEWKSVIKKTLMYGIHSLKALEAVGLTSPKSENRNQKVPALHFQIAELKIAEVKKNIKDIQTTLKSSEPNRSNSHSNLYKKSERSNRHSSQNRLTPRASKQANYHNGKFPKKLIGREIATARDNRSHRNESEKIKLSNKSITNRKNEKLSEKDENSSLSTFHPTEDMQKVFRIDFGKALDKSIPRILQPVEIKPLMHHHNFSSISAQVFCSSSEISD